MAVARLALQTLHKNRLNVGAWTRLLKPRPSFMIGPASYRLTLANSIKVKKIQKNLELITHGDKHVLNKDIYMRRPLLVLFAWMAANRRHYMKLVDFYMEQGFDCAIVTLSPYQLIWPTKGSRPITASVLQFMETNEFYDQIVIHGFSVGGYMFGEVLDLISKDPKRYDKVVNRIIGQVWDSAVDVSEMAIGTPKAAFPNNQLLQNMMKKYLEHHMRTFYKQATIYYEISSEHFRHNFVKAPALFFISKTDPIGTLANNERCINNWRREHGTEVRVKLFEDTPHVGHFRRHPKEYVSELYMFLSKLGLISDEEKIKARL